MIRNLKALGLALVAVFAMGAMAASASSAAEFHSESTHTLLDASATTTQLFEITSSGAKVECSTVKAVSGTISGTTASSVTVVPEYENCTANVGGSSLSARVTFTGCGYLFTNETTADGKHYKVHVECETSPGVKDEIHIEVFAIGKFRPCYTIPQQTPTGGGVTYTQNKLHLDVKATVTGIEYTKETGTCGPAGTANDADYTGTVTVTGTDTAGKEIGISFS